MKTRDARADHPALSSLKRQLGAIDVIPVLREPHPSAVEGQCYVNVRDRIALDGGRPLFGWLIAEAPGVVLYAWHHAVWITPSGDLVDVSPSTELGDYGTTLFAIDPEQAYDLQRPIAKPQVFEPLINDPDLHEMIRWQARADALRQAFTEHCREIPSVRTVATGITTAAEDQAALERMLAAFLPQYDVAQREQAASWMKVANRGARSLS